MRKVIVNSTPLIALCHVDSLVRRCLKEVGEMWYVKRKIWLFKGGIKKWWSEKIQAVAILWMITAQAAISEKR